MEHSLTQRQVLDIAIAIGCRILLYGGEANRAEDTVSRIGQAYGMDEVHVFAVAASIMVTVEKDGESMTQTRRIVRTNTDLDKLDARNAQQLLQVLPIAYGLIHQRYIMSPEGLESVFRKYQSHVYGTCPRTKCRKEPMVPIGLTLELGKTKVKAFCPVCRQVYDPRPEQELDGAYFGPNMAHILLDEYKDTSHPSRRYEPYQHTAFGFRVHKETLLRNRQ